MGGEFQGTGRFAIRKRLGAGGMGVVYEALDQERNSTCALKTLRKLDAQSLYRLKREFRALADLVHPNLVSLGELVEAAGEWFFTMELVDGVDFLSYVRPSRVSASLPAISETASTISVDGPPGAMSCEGVPSLDETRLRQTFCQLAVGIAALHAAGMVHRDIKPPNVLVTPEGRVVLLDFGLITETEVERQSTEAHVVGTAAYMAPEQAAAEAVGPAADWYAAGVMLFEALTGKLPFSGPTLQVFMDKRHKAAPRPSAVCRDVPPDLDQLCFELLRANPEDRPSGAAVLERLGADSVARERGSVTEPVESSHFVGREAELATFGVALNEVRAGRPASVYLHGASGVGKTALVRHFVEIASKEIGAVLLAGRCYERESVPYKAVDGVIDSLSRFMRHLPRPEAAALLPRNAALLLRVFPILARVDDIALAPAPRREESDPHELRRKVFGALRELFLMITDRYLVIVFIDDLQWADQDSFVLLEQLMRPPDAPPLLLIAASREPPTDLLETASQRPALSSWLPGTPQVIEIGPLAKTDAQNLAAHLLRRAQLESSLDASSVADEAAGHPLYIDELVRRAATAHERGVAKLQLDEAIWERTCALPAEARCVLNTICVASAPLPHQVVRRAAALGDVDFNRQVALLRVANLARSTGVRESDTVEPYHDRVREAVLGRLTDDERRERHGLLASALRRSERARDQPEVIVPHLEAIGDLAAAARFAEEGAARAATALAFDRAASLYSTAVRLREQLESVTHSLRMAFGSALASAGRRADAAKQYLLAAESAPATDAQECTRQAAVCFITSGHVDDGITCLREALASVGLGYSSKRRRALGSLVFYRALLRLRGLGFRERDAKTIAERELRRLDVCWSASSSLIMIDGVRGVSYSARHLLYALRAGEPGHIARALVIELGYRALQPSPRSRRRVAELRARLEPLVRAEPYVEALKLGALGMVNYQRGRFRAALEEWTEAERISMDVGLAGNERDAVRQWQLWALYYLGDVAELRRRALRLLEAAEDRGDRYAAANFSIGVINASWLVKDEVEAAARAADEQMSRWSQRFYHFQHYWYFVGKAQLFLYQRDVAAAGTLIREEWPALAKNHMLRFVRVRIEALELRGRALLLAAEEAREPTEHLEAVDRCVRQLRRIDHPLATAVVGALEAGAATLHGDVDAARTLLETSIRRFEDLEMSLFAAALRRRLGQLLRGDDGVALLKAAEDYMRSQEIVCPERWTAMLAPGASGRD